MTFRNEVLDFVGAYAGVSNALKKSGSDAYYEYMMKRQKAMDDEDDAARTAGENGQEYYGGAVPGGALNTRGGGALRMPRLAGGWGYSPTPAQNSGMVNVRPPVTRFGYGGVVHSFEDGGLATDPQDAAMSAADQIILESLAEVGERGATAGRRRSGGHGGAPVPKLGRMPIPGARRGVMPESDPAPSHGWEPAPRTGLEPPDKRESQYDIGGLQDSAAVSDSDFAMRPAIDTGRRKGVADSAAVSDSDYAARPSGQRYGRGENERDDADDFRARSPAVSSDSGGADERRLGPRRGPRSDAYGEARHAPLVVRGLNGEEIYLTGDEPEQRGAQRAAYRPGPSERPTGDYAPPNERDDRDDFPPGALQTSPVPIPPLPLRDSDPRYSGYNGADDGPLPARDASFREASAQANAERRRQRYIGPSHGGPSDADVDYPLPATQGAGANNADSGPLPARDATDADRRAAWNQKRKSSEAPVDPGNELDGIPREERTSVLDRAQSDTPVGKEISRLEGLILENQAKIIGSKLDVFSKTTAGERAKIDQQNAALEADNQRMRDRIQMLKRNSARQPWNKPTPKGDAPAATPAINTGGGNPYTRFQKPGTQSSLAPGAAPEGYAMNPTLPRAPSTPAKPAPTPAVASPNPGPGGAGGQSTPGGTAGRTPPPPPGAPAAQSEASLPGEDGRAAAIRRGIIDENGRVLPQQGAIDTQPPGNPTGNQGMDAQGGTGLDPQGSNQGMSSNNVAKDLENVLVSAAKYAQSTGMTPQQLASGQGAIQKPVAGQILQRYDGGGTRMHPGDRMLGGMLELYKLRLRRGDMQGAAQLALGIVQFANVQAATHGREALARLQAGDLRGAGQQFIEGHGWMMDGVNLRMSPDGTSVIATDMQGKSQQLPLDGRWLLAASKGLANGTLLWNTLNQHVASLSKPDLNARNRELNAQLTEERIKALRLKNSGGGGQAGMTYADWMRIATGKGGQAPQPANAPGDDGLMNGQDPYAMAE